jgi:hypothetical protein
VIDSVRCAVVRDRAGDRFGLGRLSDELEILLDHLPSCFNGFTAAAREEHLVKVAGGLRGQPISQFDCSRMRKGPDGKEGQLARLGCSRLH